MQRHGAGVAGTTKDVDGHPLLHGLSLVYLQLNNSNKGAIMGWDEDGLLSRAEWSGLQVDMFIS